MYPGCDLFELGVIYDLYIEVEEFSAFLLIVWDYAKYLFNPCEVSFVVVASVR